MTDRDRETLSYFADTLHSEENRKKAHDAIRSLLERLEAAEEEVERLREENRQRGFAKVRARIEAALALHEPVATVAREGYWCKTCDHYYGLERPERADCPTVKALKGEGK